MANERFVEELIHAHTELSKRACKQERMLEWMAKWIAYEFPCAFSGQEDSVTDFKRRKDLGTPFNCVCEVPLSVIVVRPVSRARSLRLRRSDGIR